VASIGDQVPRGILMLGGVTLYGLSVVAFALSPWFPLSVAIMVVVGAFHVSSHSLVQTVMQSYTEPEYRGRTIGVFQQSHVVMQIGSLALGALAGLWGAQPAMAFMAICGAIATVAIAVTVPAARKVR